MVITSISSLTSGSFLMAVFIYTTSLIWFRLLVSWSYYSFPGRDCMGCAKTGSGKTAAFVLPVLQKLSEDPYGIFCLVLTPTRSVLTHQMSLALQAGRQVTNGFGNCWSNLVNLIGWFVVQGAGLSNRRAIPSSWETSCFAGLYHSRRNG